MSSVKNVKKLFSKSKIEKRKKIKLDKKAMEPIRPTTQRSKMTLNWQQFLAQNNKEIVVKPLNNNNKNVTNNEQESRQRTNEKTTTKPDYKNKNRGFRKYSEAVAIDCEMVGIGDGRENMLARVSLVDENGQCLYDTFVKPMEQVVDYRTDVSGVRPSDMLYGKDFKVVQQEVYHIIKDKILVGHGMNNDLKVLMLSHPKRHIRDTSKYKRLRELTKGGTPSLKTLAKLILDKNIQDGEHSSVEDAHATMQIYMKYRSNWEHDIKLKHY